MKLLDPFSPNIHKDSCVAEDSLRNSIRKVAFFSLYIGILKQILLFPIFGGWQSWPFTFCRVNTLWWFTFYLFVRVLLHYLHCNSNSDILHIVILPLTGNNTKITECFMIQLFVFFARIIKGSCQNLIRAWKFSMPRVKLFKWHTNGLFADKIHF